MALRTPPQSRCGLFRLLRSWHASKLARQSHSKEITMNATLRTALAVAGCACAALPALAAPRVINACQAITEPGSYVVNRNLQATGDCLVIAADFVTIDLDGFVISGSGVGNGVGSAVLVGRRSINVRNGVITGFATGVYLEYASDVTVERVTASAN